MRKLATAAAVSLALASGGAFGLGLGDIEMRSALNQPMNAEIRLSSIKPGELQGMIVQLASPDAFARAGIERSQALTDLEFSVDQSSGVPVIRISSKRPIVEPFLNFLLEVDWPQGRMVREYTVLLDPPVFMTPTATERNTAADQPAIVQRGEEALVVPTPIERSGGGNTLAGDALSDDEFNVELVGLDGETDNLQGSTIADEGEIVSLGGITDNGLLSGGEPVSLDDGEIVSLSDLNAPNTAALAQREQTARQALDLDSIEVELVGSSEEVPDTLVVGGTPAEVADDGSTIVSLDDLNLQANVATGSAGERASAAADEVSVRSGDTLYRIAQRNAVAGASVQQMMMALLAANESAFINNNINLVKAGAILRIPTADEATRLSQTQALAAIGQQNQLWQEYRDNLRNSGVTRVAASDVTAVDSATADDAEAPASDTTAIETASLEAETAETVDAAATQAEEGLSEEARRILEEARNEILQRDELRIVADNAAGNKTASATADETTDRDAERLGEVNRKLQLAREELAATRLRSDDLSDQAGELRDTNENLDALVTLRQNEIAQLEAQLADARQAMEESAATAAADAAGDAVDRTTEAASDAADAVAGAADNAADAIVGAVDEAGVAVADAADTAADAASDAVSAAGDAASEVVDSGENALTAAGQELGQVELLDEESGDTAASGDDTTIALTQPATQTTWYQDFLNDPKRMMIAGIGGVGLLGVLGTLLFRRRRREDDGDLLDVANDIDFIDDEEAAQLQADMSVQARELDLGAVGGAAAGAAGGAAAAASLAADQGVPADTGEFGQSPNTSFDDMADESLALGSETQAVADATSDDGIDKDDTISEVDVYLAYGLHGQAEELLTKAIERKPDNPVYLHKLLQTYHAQGNGEGFHKAAEDFHSRFGGEENPDWPAIAAMGAELRPGEPLYSSGRDAISAIGAGHSDGSALGDEDFASALDDADSGSISRDFGSSEEAVDMDDDESALMDESIDPAFAFDESDLEATGDFSGLASELESVDDDGSIDFPGFESSDPADLTDDLTSELSADLTDGDDLLGDAMTLDELDGVTSADDLTLDLDQLSGDLELDSAELMNSDLSDLDLSDLTADNELLIDDAAGDGADEMDTMLDLAKAYIDMGDKDSASSALGEIVKSGNPEQINEAETLLRKIS